MEDFIARSSLLHIALLLVIPLVWLLRHQPKTKPERAAWYFLVFVLVGSILTAVMETFGLGR